ncbi:MAG: rhamnulokinase [Acidobacteria bacterium]|nr:rhamnulokinase [Acidobacteriota bacterium]
MTAEYFLAFDLGAESARAMLGSLENGQIRLTELHRFPSRLIRCQHHLHWNVYYLFEEIRQVLEKTRHQGLRLRSLGIDTWGVDFGLIDSSGHLLGLPYCYRDKAFPVAAGQYFREFPAGELYQLTGIQFMPFNSIFQLYALQKENSHWLKQAEKMLFMPDLLNFLLTGVKATDLTIASTSQLLSPFNQQWLPGLVERMGINAQLLPEINLPGKILGRLSPWLVEDGLPDVSVVEVAGHDTASAIAAVPAEGDDWAYISSGTWSLIGVELSQPLVNERSLQANFTNESGLGKTIRFLKNVTGLWLLQQCRKIWSRQGDLSYEQLTELAEKARPFELFLDPDIPQFLNPENMVEAITGYARQTGQAVPAEPGAMTRAILESLALKYRLVIDELEVLTGRKFKVIHIIGGGSKNSLLNQFTAEATGRPVLAGPEEATSAGNVLIQAMAAGQLEDRQTLRKIVRQSFEIKEYRPHSPERWDQAFSEYKSRLAEARNNRPV